MSKRLEIAVIGADSPVAEALFDLMAERRFPVAETSALVLDPESEADVRFADRPLLLDDARTFDFTQVQLAFLTDADPELTAQAERAADAGVVVVDASSQNWRDSAIPVVAADVNPAAIAGFNERGIVALPDRLNVALAPILRALHGLFGLQAVTLTGLLAASDGGRPALEDLARETAALLNARAYERQYFARQIAFNVLGQDGDAGVDGATERERRIGDELRMLLGLPTLAVQATLVQVPVFYGHSASITLRFERNVDVEAAAAALQALPDFALEASQLAADGISPVTDAALSSRVQAGRLRRVDGDPLALALWLTADNIRRCAASAALSNAELLVRDHLT
ncbi:aspartate-semialdehyde dehydrogenase [Solimonas marina]|uniref:N-acetyl-gamma-glutamyl-phosphate reductase n=1 Tax=Solimonas marina TaxID=2714601 RepID=A0A969WD19_9GAMM|nr:Asd/ArgC dimerization domain-containing protein [Solimonas marina]NKF24299.1 N-acetyl-gamma-glutamyl-phosphate reductase [Solimonas marina]